ncbi:YkoP family protein [Caldalkalibacillus salinus]|uniref:YkoP family protein n=1 Tax=Caldalkalibacillus salinus TaxID=2803787 RepID=UPI001923DFBF|nr:hypothetical protein [Caldalkalibacillus salinus]
MKTALMVLWALWDWLYFQCNRMQYVSKGDNLFRVVRKTYRGPELKTKSGKCIKPGDEIIKIHIYNYGLAKEVLNHRSSFSLAIYLKNRMLQSLEGLTDYVTELPDQHKIVGIIGTSMLNRGAERLGFTTHEVDINFHFWIKGFLYKLIYMMVHPAGHQYLVAHGKRLKSKHLVMSLEELMERYAKQTEFQEIGDQS